MTAKSRHGGGHEEEHENGERWLLTYADMITLLLALFIVLFAISSINQKKFLALALGLKETFDPKPGVLPHSDGLAASPALSKSAGPQQVTQQPTFQPLSPTPTTTTAQTPTTTTAQTPPNPAGQQDLPTIQKQIQKALAQKGISGSATTQVTARGLVVQILADEVFFATDSASLGTKGDEVVDTIASVLVTDTNDVIVEGYTDNQPILGGPYTSNMELSAVRAVNVVTRLYQGDGIAESRLGALGYGETRPQASNDNAGDQAQNRRIDVVVLGPGQTQP